MARMADRFWNSYVHSRDRLRRLSARSLHTWVLFRIATAARNRDDRSAQKKRREKKRVQYPTMAYPDRSLRARRTTAGGSRPGLVGFPSYTPIAAPVCRPHRKSTTGSRKSRFSRPSAATAAAAVDICPHARRAKPHPGAFCTDDNDKSTKPIGRTLTIAPRSIAISRNQWNPRHNGHTNDSLKLSLPDRRHFRTIIARVFLRLSSWSGSPKAMISMSQDC